MIDKSEYLEYLLVLGESKKIFFKKQHKEYEVNFEFLGFAINDERNYMAFTTTDKIRIFQFDNQCLKPIKSLYIKGMNQVKFLKNSNSFILYNSQKREKIYYIQYVNKRAQWEQKQTIIENAYVNELQISQDNEKLFILDNQAVKLFLKGNGQWLFTAMYKHYCMIFDINFCWKNNNLIILDQGLHYKILDVWNCQFRTQNILLKIKNGEENMKQTSYNDFLIISSSRAVYLINFHAKKILRRFLPCEISLDYPKMNSLILLQTKARNYPLFSCFPYITSEDGFLILINIQRFKTQKESKMGKFLWIEFQKS